ncbi:hypothetical protein RHGRI_004331 [Rhododendron griersonianum]|uniref:RING-type E3 ubiquitin transferase n=1 Tax=Rhododendron griersonianum TaxID=479676 RepID=A0AAV6L8H5_9ERIC|nr:hypothetical protein RHGRI_004331 [Rhododendron griersonianum]
MYAIFNAVAMRKILKKYDKECEMYVQVAIIANVVQIIKESRVFCKHGDSKVPQTADLGALVQLAFCVRVRYFFR